MSRFDETIFPTIEEVRDRCADNLDAVVGECQMPWTCVITTMLADRLPSDVKVGVYPALARDGAAILSWPDEGSWLGLGEQTFVLPAELNRLANRFDTIGLAGRPVWAHEVIPICDTIIAERVAVAA